VHRRTQTNGVLKVIKETVLIFLLVMSQSTYATTLEENFQNIFYFEYATVSANHCEEKGFPSRSIFKKWQLENVHIQKDIASEINENLLKTGLNQNQASQLMEEMKHTYQRMAIEEVGKNGVPCRAYREFLSGFHTLPSSRYKSIP